MNKKKKRRRCQKNSIGPRNGSLWVFTLIGRLIDELEQKKFRKSRFRGLLGKNVLSEKKYFVDPFFAVLISDLDL